MSAHSLLFLVQNLLPCIFFPSDALFCWSFISVTMFSAIKVSVVRMSSSTLENPSTSHVAKLTLSILRTHSDKDKSSSSSSVVATLHSISADTSSWIIPAWRKQFQIVFLLCAPRPYEQIKLHLTNLCYRLPFCQYIQSFAAVLICENDTSDFKSLLF